MNLIGIDQELRSIIVDGQTEMVGDPFVQVQAGCPLKCRREVGPFGPVFHVRAAHRQLANTGFDRPVGITSYP